MRTASRFTPSARPTRPVQSDPARFSRPRWFGARFLAVAAIAFIAACSSPEERAQAHHERGAEYLQDGDHTRAMLEFRNAVKLDERHSEAWFGIALVEEQNQNWRAVANALQHVIELDTGHVEARMKLARLHLAGGDIEKALELANAANQLKPDDSEILALTGAVLLRLNDRAGATSNAERALAIDRDNPDPYAVLAADAMLDENTAAALRMVERGLIADPQNTGLLLFKLKIHEQENDVQNAEAVMRRLIVVNPDKKDIRRGLVAFLLEHDRTDDAETEMRNLVAASPGDAAAALELVRFIHAQKGTDAARHELDRLMDAHPEVVDYELATARLELSRSRPDAATDLLQGIIARGAPDEDVQRARLLLAEMKSQSGEPEAAAALVAEVLAADGRNADALALRARLRLQAGDYESATADLRAALNEAPQSVELHQLLAKAFERQGNVDLANDNYVQAVRAANYAPAAALDYARFLTGRGELARADAILSESLARVPNSTEVLAALGQIRLRQRDWVGAQEAAELLKKLGDRSGASGQILGAALLGQQKFDQSIETLKDAYAATPQAVRPLYSLVSAYVRAGNLDEAESFLASMLEASPDNADAHVLRGLLHALNDEPADAAAAYDLAIERQPANPVGYRALAQHLIAGDRIEEAEAVLLRGREQAPGDLGLDLFYAGLLERKPDPEGALGVYEDMLRKRPDGLILINNVASLMSQHKTDEASLERAYQLALRLRDVDMPHFKDTLGWVHYRRGEYRAAADYLEAAVEGLPDHPQVRYHLARTYAALERHDDAKAQFARAAELVGDDDPLGERIRQALDEVSRSQTLN
jgi:cellulose synthase operon protein C